MTIYSPSSFGYVDSGSRWPIDPNSEKMKFCDYPGGAPNTTFTKFWSAVNSEMVAIGRPELTFGPALRLWESTKAEAERAAGPVY